MTHVHSLCLFCLTKTTDGFSTSGDSEAAKNAREIINQHFWFDKESEELNSHDSFVCDDCWYRILSFHKFYLRVAAVYIDIVEKDNESEKDNDEVEVESNDLPTTISEYDENDEDAKVIGLEIDIITPIILDYDSDKNENDLENTRNSKKEPKSIGPKNKRSKYRNVETIVCFMCNKTFKSFWNLKLHFLTHDPESRIFECEVCPSKFARASLLTNHIKYVHELRGKYVERTRRKVKCPICDKLLSYNALKYHISTIHEEKKPKKPNNDEVRKCKTCSKEFKGASLLAQHETSHVDRKLTEVQCDICQKWMKNKYILGMHKKIHEQSPKKCPHCDKIKPNEAALKSHISTAHSVPKHKCTECEKSFTRPKSLKEHMAIHTGQPLYNCSFCSKSFNSDANMYAHMKTFHKRQWNLRRVKSD